MSSTTAFCQQPDNRASLCWLLSLALWLTATAANAQGTGTSAADGPGVLIRAEHIEGQGIPQVDSITPLQLFPYLLEDNTLLFGDLRFYTTNDGLYGGNGGLGYRHYVEALDYVLGISGWYDADNSREVYFQQTGLSVEAYGSLCDLRGNLYAPIGEKEQLQSLTLVNGSTRFSGNGLVYGLVRSTFVSMYGGDAELGLALPTEFLQQHGVRVYGGGYYYEDDRNNSITGLSGRVQANLFRGLDAQVQVTHDDFYQTRAFAGVSWTFGRLHPSRLERSNASRRIGEHVTRNYTVLAPLREQLENQFAVNPATGLNYKFAHVNDSAGLAAAQALNPDILFVHAGTTINAANPIVLAAGQRLLGDGAGVTHTVLVPEFGNLALPSIGASGTLPRITNSLGDGVRLASGSEVSGFTFSNIAGHAISGSGVGDVKIASVAIDSTTGDGIRLVNTTGTNSISNVGIANTAGRGIAIDGGSAKTDLSGAVTVSNAANAALSIKNLAAAGAVNIGTFDVNRRQGRGIEIDGTAGAVNVTSRATVANENNSTASALDIRNSSGNFNFARLDATNTTGSAGVNLQDNTGRTFFDILNITSQGGTALRAANAGTLAINPAVNGTVDFNKGGIIAARDGTAVDLQGTLLDINLTSVGSTNATRGISMVDTTGQFVVVGNSIVGSGGTIHNAGTGIFLKNTGLTALQLMTLDGNDVGIQADNVGELVFLHSAIVGSTTYGIDALNTPKLTVANTSFTGNATGNIRGQFDKVGSYAYIISSNNLIASGTENVVIRSLAGSAGSTMNFLSQADAFQNLLNGTSAVKVDWNGALSATMADGTVSVFNGNNIGFEVSNASTTAVSGVTMTKTIFNGSGGAFTNNLSILPVGNDTAFKLTTQGPSQVRLTSNTINFNAQQGTGLQLALASSSTVEISNNTITDTVDGTTGILFQSVAAPANITIGGNIIDMANQGALLDRGIIFQGVTGSIHLVGPANNTVTDTNTPFFVPAGSSTGNIFVNGASVP